MNNLPGDDTALIADSVERLFGGTLDRARRERAESGVFDAELWREVVDAGLPMMMATEAAGGLALGGDAAYPVLRAIGYWHLPLPLAETMIAAHLLSRAGMPVPDVAAGPITLVEQSQSGALHARSAHDTVFASGIVHRAHGARHAQAALIALTDGRIALLDLRHEPGVTVQPFANAAAMPCDTLLLHEARCVAVGACPLPLSRPVWTLGALARSAMMAGALEWALAQTVAYAGERVQFGKPIGRNQAIQQNLALMAGDVAAARMAATIAAADWPSGGGDAAAALFSTAVAKVRCGEAATRATAIAHQVHGAIGFTREHALHFATRRLWAWREDYGSDAWWAAELGRAAIAARAEGFWPGITGKRFAALD